MQAAPRDVAPPYTDGQVDVAAAATEAVAVVAAPDEEQRAVDTGIGDRAVA
jgi:hypothetical protein